MRRPVGSHCRNCSGCGPYPQRENSEPKHEGERGGEASDLACAVGVAASQFLGDAGLRSDAEEVESEQDQGNERDTDPECGRFDRAQSCDEESVHQAGQWLGDQGAHHGERERPHRPMRMLEIGVSRCGVGAAQGVGLRSSGRGAEASGEST